MEKDIRWKQRFENLKKAMLFLKDSVEQKSYNRLEAAGLAQSFEFTFELSWKTLKDYLTEIGYTVRSPKETIKQSFQNEIIKDGHIWMQMLEERNRLTHTYNEEQAQAAVKIICEGYYPALLQVFEVLQELD